MEKKEKEDIFNSSLSEKKEKTKAQINSIENLTEQQKKSCMKFVGHYLDLFPITGSSLTAKEIKHIEKNIAGKDLSFNSMSGKVMTLVGKNDAVKSCFVYLLNSFFY